MDQAREYRAACDLAEQSKQAQALHHTSLRREIAQARQEREDLCLQLGIDACAEVDEVTQLIERKSTERSKTAQIIGETERQIGEITERLNAARKIILSMRLNFKALQ